MKEMFPRSQRLRGCMSAGKNNTKTGAGEQIAALAASPVPAVSGWFCAALVCAALFTAPLCVTATAATGAPAPAPRSAILDSLPRLASQNAFSAAVTRSRSRGDLAGAAWLEAFYGNAAAKLAAARDIATALRSKPNDARAWFVCEFIEEQNGQAEQTNAAALRVLQLAPNDVASELQARTLGGTLDEQGRALLQAAPVLREILARPLSDPDTAYMLGRPLLALVGAPGVPLSAKNAALLSGRLTAWKLYGPVGDWRNLGFDRTAPIETQAGAFASNPRLAPQYVQTNNGAVSIPEDWGTQGMDYAVSYIHVPTTATYLLRSYSDASLAISINGVRVLRNDRRSSYRSATSSVRLRLQSGWNRLVIKLAGNDDRSFEVLLRPESGAAAYLDTASAPAGMNLAGAPRPQSSPLTLRAWADGALHSDPKDPVALWARGTVREQDENAEGARVDLAAATAQAPNCALAWTRLAEAYRALPDASSSWSNARASEAAHAALKADPRALAARATLGHIAASQGRAIDAIKQFTQCTGRGYSDCDWAQFAADSRQGWIPEARTALQHAVAASGSYWSRLVQALSFYYDQGDAAQAQLLRRRLLADPRAARELAGFELGHGRPAEAARLLSTAMKLDPSSATLTRQYLMALNNSGQVAAAESAAQQALRDFPYDWRIAQEASEIANRKGPQAAIATLRANDYNRGALRNEADFLAGNRFWMPWYHSAQSVIKNAPGKKQYPNASAILVLDQMVDRVNPDSTRDAYIHQVYRVLDSVGIEAHGQQSIPAGSDLITLRTIKKDGTVLLPENLSNLSSVSMPGLAPGDFIETEYVMHLGQSDVVPGTLDNSMFFVFSSSKEPYHYSDYIVLSPKNYPLKVEQARFPEKMTERQIGNWVSREWLIQKTRIVDVEPDMPPQQELVPKVWISSHLTWNEIGSYLADQLYTAERTTAEMQRTAQRVTAGKTDPIQRADALYQWVAQHIQPMQMPILSPPRQSFTDGSGSRMAVFIGLLHASDTPFNLVFARAATDHSSTQIPSLYGYQLPLIRVPGANGKYGWYDLLGTYAHLGFISSAIRGGQALVINPHGGVTLTQVPNFVSPEDGYMAAVEAQVQPNGDANLNLTLTFHGPLAQNLRQSLSSAPPQLLPQLYQKLILNSYPNATSTGGSIDDLAAQNHALVIHLQGTEPGFVRVEDGHWDIPELAPPVDVTSRYATLPSREHPLVINGDALEQTQVTVHFPAQFGTPQAPGNVDTNNDFGHYQVVYSTSPHELRFDRTMLLRGNYITPAQYQQFRAFGSAIAAQDALRVSGATAGVVSSLPSVTGAAK